MNERPTESKERRTKSFLGVGLAVVLAGAAFFSGFQLGTGEAITNQEASLWSLFTAKPVLSEEGVDMTEFWRVWQLMNEKYVATTATSTLSDLDKVRGAIEGLVASYGDPYSTYLPPEDASQFGEDISGNFGGVGMEVGVRNGLITVIAPLPGTPAEQAGILSGDVIVKIDGQSTESMNVDEAVNLIRGEKGSTVHLTLYRDGETDFIELAVVRDTINIPTVKTEQKGDVFYIALYSFNALSEAKMQEALRSYVQSGTTKLILDLRGNPGGYLQSAVAIASYFLPSGEVVVREQYGSGQAEDLYRSQGRTLKQFAPSEMVVLIDGGSASAAEILAGALQEHGVATLIGETTFGKGSVQELVDLPDGASLKVTIARWLTPNGTSISKAGLTPDVAVERTGDDMVAGKDPQLDAALAWLHGDKSVASSTPANGVAE